MSIRSAHKSIADTGLYSYRIGEWNFLFVWIDKCLQESLCVIDSVSLRQAGKPGQQHLILKRRHIISQHFTLLHRQGPVYENRPCFVVFLIILYFKLYKNTYYTIFDGYKL